MILPFRTKFKDEAVVVRLALNHTLKGLLNLNLTPPAVGVDPHTLLLVKDVIILDDIYGGS